MRVQPIPTINAASVATAAPRLASPFIVRIPTALALQLHLISLSTLKRSTSNVHTPFLAFVSLLIISHPRLKNLYRDSLKKDIFFQSQIYNEKKS
jgi:hypothetical protein